MSSEIQTGNCIICQSESQLFSQTGVNLCLSCIEILKDIKDTKIEQIANEPNYLMDLLNFLKKNYPTEGSAVCLFCSKIVKNPEFFACTKGPNHELFLTCFNCCDEMPDERFKSSLHIREYWPSDHDELVALINDLPEWFDKNARENIPIDLHFQKGVVASRITEICGFLSFFVYEGIGNIAWMAVKRNTRRRGIGKKLLDYFEFAMRQNGVKICQVYTLGDSVDYKPYNETRAFYYKNGYKEFKRVKTDNPSCPEELFLRKVLEKIP